MNEKISIFLLLSFCEPKSRRRKSRQLGPRDIGRLSRRDYGVYKNRDNEDDDDDGYGYGYSILFFFVYSQIS